MKADFHSLQIPTQNFGVLWSTKPPFRRALHCGRQRVFKDAKQFATEKLHPKIELDVVAFFNSLGEANLDEVEAGIDEMEDVISQLRVAVKNEHSRRSLEDQIVKLTHKKNQKEEE